MRIPFCVESESYVGASVKFMRGWSGRIEEQYCATLKEGNDKVIAVNDGNGIIAIKGVVENSGPSETQLIGVDETVRQLVSEPETFIDDEDVSLSRLVVGVRSRCRYDWNIALG